MTSARARNSAARTFLAFVVLAALTAAMSAACGVSHQSATPEEILPPKNDAPAESQVALASSPIPARTVSPTGQPAETALAATPLPTAITTAKASQTETPTVEVSIQTLTTDDEANLPQAFNDILRTKEESYFRGVKMGEAFIEGGGQTLIEFNGQAITTGEYLEAKVRYAFGLETLRQSVKAVRPREGGSSTQGVHSDLLFSNPELRQQNAAILEINELHNADSWVLIKLIGERAAISVARAQGFVVSHEEITNRLSDIRARANNRMSDPWYFNKYDDEIRGYISVVGSERYWSDILPERFERELVLRLWYSEQSKKLGPGGSSKALHDVTQEAIHHSEIKVHDFSTLSPDVVGIKDLLAVNNSLLEVAATSSSYKISEK